MKIESTQKTLIQNSFKSMNSKDDFIAMLNLAKEIIYGDKFTPFELKQLNYYINKKVLAYKKLNSEKLFLQETNDNTFANNILGQFYNQFTIKKKSGGDRLIYSPTKGLKELQKALNVILQCIYEPHFAATGFVNEKSIVDNGKIHVGQIFVCNLDLKDFFPSIDQSRIWGRLLVEPFNLNTTLERKKIANIIASLTCTNMEVERLINNKWTKVISSVLPQGAPTSPILSNAICEKLDKKMIGVAKRFGLNYTRYADDITFSGKHNSHEVTKNVYEKIFISNSTFDIEIRKIISSQSFTLNENKYRLQKESFRQEVTGLTVNNKINVPRRYIKQIRQWLYYWEAYGYEKAYILFMKKYSLNKAPKRGNTNMEMVIYGKLLYLKMVKGDNDETFIKLKERFDQLTNSKNPISEILDIWENEGIEKAMEFYYTFSNK